MKSIVFGAGGYLGKHLVHALRASGSEVRIPATADGNRIDLTEPASLQAMDWDVDAVFLFAGVTGTIDSFIQYEKSLFGNNLILLNILDSIRKSEFRPRLLFPSSRLVYHGAEAPLTESAEKLTKTLYAANKLACENYLHAYSAAFDLPYTILRICVPYANSLNREYSFGTIGSFIKQIKQSGRIRLYGGGHVRRTFTHVGDVCRLTMLAAQHPMTLNATFNMPGEDMSLFEAATLIAKRMGGAAIDGADWPAQEWRIESGSTVFDGSSLLKTLHTALSCNFKEWADTV